MIKTTTRRSFLSSLLLLGAAPMILPSAATYSRIWKPERKLYGYLVGLSIPTVKIYSSDHFARVRNQLPLCKQTLLFRVLGDVQDDVIVPNDWFHRSGDRVRPVEKYKPGGQRESVFVDEIIENYWLSERWDDRRLERIEFDRKWQSYKQQNCFPK